MASHYKDAVLNDLAQDANVAQFVSFSPDLDLRFGRLYEMEPNPHFESLTEALETILETSPENEVNVRSFDPDDPKSKEFVYGLSDLNEIEATVRRLAGNGLHTIVNETIDVEDGGVSGVVLGDVIEFAPEDTPRAVERPGTASLPRDLGLRLLDTVYGFKPALDYDSTVRVEFSIHPLRRGFRREHTIIWELEEVGSLHTDTEIVWPNRFSRFMGDKAYGLLVADLLGLPVPACTVFGRSIAPFRFGQETGSSEIWVRTAPNEQVPGKYTTTHGWTDPFLLMQEEDPDGENISSLVIQQNVDAKYSGGLVSTEDGKVTVEGVKGYGDKFMSGKADTTDLPDDVHKKVLSLYEKAYQKLGPVRLEWAVDANQAWIIQFHLGSTESIGRTIYPGEADTYRHFDVQDGLETLRELIEQVKGTGEGVIVHGNVGVTSHFGDILRKARIPSEIEPKPRKAEEVAP